MQLIDVFKYRIKDKVYVIEWASEETICECCGQEYYTDPVPIGVIQGDICARKFVEDNDPENFEKSGIYYRVCTERKNGIPIWFRNVLERDWFSTKEKAEKELKRLQNES